jgi:hypothetical protein
MKVILKLFIFLTLFLSFWIVNNTINTTNAANNLNVTHREKWENNRNKLLKVLKDDNFFWTRYGWTKWAYWLMFRIAKDLKNLFFVLATLYLFIIVIRLLYSGESDEWFTKFKKWVIWISVWIFVIQAAYAYVKTLYDKDIWQNLALSLNENLVDPLIGMLQIFASVVFLIMAIIAFYQLITANWNDETAKKWKMTIVYAIIWFILIKLAKLVVDSVYWKLNCDNSLGGIVNCVNTAEIDWFAWTILQIINWMNSFIWLVVVIMIIYAWMQILTSWWDEEKTKKAKKSLIYIMIWLILLFTNYIILTFFIKHESLI